MTFSQLGLSTDIAKAVEELGYKLPTPIQEKVIPHVLMGRDILGIAQTGTGKTASFILPMLDILHGKRSRSRMPRSLVLEPTRELAAQVYENFEIYGKYHKLKAALLVGGEPMGEQERILNKGVDVLIATPGRLLDLFERGMILMNDLKILVIDEADRMMDMGFIPDINRIVALLPKIRQTLFFSATATAETNRLAQAYLINPKEIVASPQSSAAETIEQYKVNVANAAKTQAVLSILKQKVQGEQQVLIFCNRKKDVSILAKALKTKGFLVEGLHGDLHQSKRGEILDAFKQKKFSILVASDIAARGLDVTELSFVINYDIPFNTEDYIHRIGRTGRAGNQGCSITLVGPTDGKKLKAIEKLMKKTIPDLGIDLSSDDPLTDKEDVSQKTSSAKKVKVIQKVKRVETAEKVEAVDTAETKEIETEASSEGDETLEGGTEGEKAARRRPRRRRQRKPKDAMAATVDTTVLAATTAEETPSAPENTQAPESLEPKVEKTAEASPSKGRRRRGRGKDKSKILSKEAAGMEVAPTTSPATPEAPKAAAPAVEPSRPAPRKPSPHRERGKKHRYDFPDEPRDAVEGFGPFPPSFILKPIVLKHLTN